MPDTTYETREGDVLDLICFRHYKRSSGAVEAVLEANRGIALSDRPTVLPRGLFITLPEISDPAAVTQKLWD